SGPPDRAGQRSGPGERPGRLTLQTPGRARSPRRRPILTKDTHSMTVLEHTRAPQTETGRRRSLLGSRWTPYLFLAPAALLIAIFQGVLLAHQVFLSFPKASRRDPTNSSWVGLENYAHIFGDDDFRRTLLITLVYVVVSVVGSVGSGLLVALLLNRGFR